MSPITCTWSTCSTVWIIVLLCYNCLLVVHGLSFANQDEFIQNLKDYQIVIPNRVTREGDHLTFHTHPQHTVRKRSVANGNQQSENEQLHYKVQIDNTDHILQLRLNSRLVSPGIVVEHRRNRFNNITDSKFNYLHDAHKNCHYHGAIFNKSGSTVALGLCDGLHGFIHTEDNEYFIEPLKKESVGPEGEYRHIVYKRSALPVHLDPLRAVKPEKRSTKDDDSCGVQGYNRQFLMRKRWEQHRQKRKSSEAHHRSRRSFSTERYVETLVVVDPSMIKYHKNEHLETYVLTIMNMVSAMFYDASIGNSINIVLVRILLLEEHQEELVITHHADKTLSSFCKFQKKINFKEDDHPNHHDVAILLTRHNICSRLNEPCSTLGLAQVSGMCQPHRTCNINEDTGLALAYTVTHELGHNFGMHHDSTKNGCKDPPGMQLYIMSPSLVADSLTKTWSNCSKEAITKFIDRDWGYCLDDEPSDHDYKFPVLPPGTMYDADHQCRLQYGNDEASICTNEQDVCSNLWCRSENRCSTHLEAAAEGTICGDNKWCYQGQCVKIGDRPEAINGEWGVWSSWTECTRTCGAGVSHSQRHCDNPQPSHGGKYCIGERKRYRICNTDDCPEDGVTFNVKQCQEFNIIPYKGRLYEWEHVQTKESPCQLHCKPKDHFFSVLLKDIVTDGTPCTPGTRNMCISGRCRHVGCDYAIDSSAKEDRCGICHGDGSTCTTIKSQYNESQGLGYVQAAVIPTGARNIRVEEVAAANNFLALQNDKGEYYLNGHWFIQWSGDYKVAGTVVQYKREANLESFLAAGPLTEPLHIMLLLQSENPGLEFEYTVPKNNVTEARVPEFSWHYLHWSHCTASCGGGSQRSEIVCTEIEAGVVDEKYCDPSTKPDDKQRVCNDHLCPARWWVGPWQHCSVTCGDEGQHHRTVICVRSLGQDEQIALDDDACAEEDKPAEWEPCKRKDPCPGHSHWMTGDWSSCNGNLCGVMVRTVTCEDPVIGCDQTPVPESEMRCSPIQCGEWVTGDWQQCTRTCDEGLQVRNVWCEGSEHCDIKSQPAEQRTCVVRECPVTTMIEHTTTTTTTTSPGKALLEMTEKPSANLESVEHTHSIESEVKNDHVSEPQAAKKESEKDVVDSAETVNQKPESKHKMPGLDTNHEDDDDDFDIDVEDFHENKPRQMGETDSKKVEASDADNSLEDEYVDATFTAEPIVDDMSTDTPNVDADKSVGITDSPPKHKENHMTRHPHRRHHGETGGEQGNHPNGHSGHINEDIKKGINENIKDNKELEITEIPVSGEESPLGNTAEDTEISNKNPSGETQKMPKLFGQRKLSPLPDMDELPPLTLNTGDLPALPNIKDLAPIPDLEDLPPLNEQDLPSLPKIPDFDMPDKLPELPKKKTLPKMPDVGDLPKLGDLPPLSELYELNNPDLSLYGGKGNTKYIHSAKSDDITKDIPLETDADTVIESENAENVNAGLPPLFNNINMPVEDSNEIKDHHSNTKDINKHSVLGGASVGSVKSRVTPSYDWRTSEWTGCSRECGGGVRTRTVQCVDQESGVETDPSICDIHTRPSAVQECNSNQCMQWRVSDWTPCSTTCGHSVRLRQVACQTEGSCDSKERPVAEERCDVPKCVMWVSGEWSRCSKKCGGGEQVRLIQCVNITSQLPGRGCNYGDKPDETQSCNVETCERENAAMEISCVHNEYSHGACNVLKKLNQCHKRFIKLKCCVTCNKEHVRAVNKDRPRTRALR